jgi:hypothetical protein
LLGVKAEELQRHARGRRPGGQDQVGCRETNLIGGTTGRHIFTRHRPFCPP